MKIEKRNSYLLLFSIITGSLMFFCLQFYTIPNEYKDFHNMNLSERLNVHYLNYHPRFDYFNGLWLMFGGLEWFCIVVLLDLPIHTNNALELIKTRFKRKH